MKNLKKQTVFIVSGNTAWTKVAVACLATSFECYSFKIETSVEKLWGLPQETIVVFDKSSLGNPSSLCISPAERGGKWLIVNGDSIDEQSVAGTIALGFSGLIVSPFTLEMLPRALRTIASDQLWFSREAMSQTLKHLVSSAGSTHHSVNILGAKYTLSCREQQVFLHLLHGKSNKDIAALLHLSPSTVKCHVSSILLKTGKRSRSQINMLLLDAENHSQIRVS
ncbi:response regulator transcription factor [Shewanella sp. Isolate13]|uniref:helix-turn-helix transcriptional regulator n=1 Tax=Shewanella sp. Isolate13 TaxID=2908531 RepID=UPI001EFCE2DE|nr:response regulator transcription factor [Shewanella sp. Isolate13]MCG9730836.1 response regulator transcription factor [Shewanella sp. Isolate13]